MTSLTKSSVDQDLAHGKYTRAKHLDRDISSGDRGGAGHPDSLSISDTAHSVVARGVVQVVAAIVTNAHVEVLKSLAVACSVHDGDVCNTKNMLNGHDSGMMSHG